LSRGRRREAGPLISFVGRLCLATVERATRTAFAWRLRLSTSFSEDVNGVEGCGRPAVGERGGADIYLGRSRVFTPILSVVIEDENKRRGRVRFPAETFGPTRGKPHPSWSSSAKKGVKKC
jgi:hypothetical protein